MSGSAAESLLTSISVLLPGGIALGLLGYVSALLGIATLLRIGALRRIPALTRAEAPFALAEGQRAVINRQGAGLVLVSIGVGLILTACALEGYLFALIAHLAAG